MGSVTSLSREAHHLDLLKRKGKISSEDPSTAMLKSAVESSLALHRSLPEAERIANSKAAAQSVGKHVGMRSKFQAEPLLTANMKLEKAQKGYELDNKNTIKTTEGKGVETTGLALAPAYEEGKFNTCPNSASCKKICLGKTSGNYFKGGGGNDLNQLSGPRLASYKRTQAFLRDPEAFAVRLHDEIQTKKEHAAANGNQLGVRLNVLSDIHPKVWKPLMDAHPDVQFYDYTKNNSSAVAPNHHLTYSSTGVSQPGIVENPHQNWHLMRSKLEKGSNVAMAFSHREVLPTEVHDEETGQTYHVLDGDQHDFRPIDGKAPNGKGWIVGLRRKAANLGDKTAAEKSDGFFVHYDPKLKTKRSESGAIVQDRGPKPLDPETGKPKGRGAPVPTVTTVTIAKQRPRTIYFDNDSKKVPIGKEP